MDAWLQEFSSWVTDEEETIAYVKIFSEDYLPCLPRDIKNLILIKFWAHCYKKALPFGLANVPRTSKR